MKTIDTVIHASNAIKQQNNQHKIALERVTRSVCFTPTNNLKQQLQCVGCTSTQSQYVHNPLRILRVLGSSPEYNSHTVNSTQTHLTFIHSTFCIASWRVHFRDGYVVPEAVMNAMVKRKITNGIETQLLSSLY
jgi:hypothetical protein